MVTPIVMLLLMVGPYRILRSFPAARRRDFDGRGAAAVGLGLLFVFTSVGHFIQTAPMALMLPPWVPARIPLVYATGVLEFAIAAGFFVPRTRRLAGWAAAAVLVLFLPANVYAALNHVPMGGHAWGPQYLLIRIPVQIMILLWVYWFALRPINPAQQARPVNR